MRRPITSTHRLVAARRSPGRYHSLATVLAAVAGAANAGGFFALGAYTSHMTGYLSQLADNLVLWNLRVAGTSILAIAAFVSGAAFSAFLVNWARAHDKRQQFALPLAVQGVFLLCFSGGGMFSSEAGRLFSLWCLCFIMGMQNATITKISGARIRTTHATGMITDIGIEIGRAVFGRMMPGRRVDADRFKLRILGQLVGAFVIGGVVGAFGYGRFGFVFSVPLGLVLLTMSLPTLALWREHGNRPDDI